VFLVGSAARLLIVGQAPGRRVHETGIPWNDPSGDALREWLAIGPRGFLRTARASRSAGGALLPGRVNAPTCASSRVRPAWQPRFRAAFPAFRLTLLVGRYAQAITWESAEGNPWRKRWRAYRDYLPEFFPLPHPSWRNRRG